MWRGRKIESIIKGESKWIEKDTQMAHLLELAAKDFKFTIRNMLNNLQ